LLKNYSHPSQSSKSLYPSVFCWEGLFKKLFPTLPKGEQTMLNISGRVKIEDVVRAFGAAESQLPFAIAKTLTKTGQQVKAAEEAGIVSAFQNPTPYTRRAVYLQGATKARLQARVWLKDGNRPEHYLLPQIDGGGRPLKRFEQRLRMLGFMGSDQRAVPGKAVQLDAYGNMSRGQITKILSQLKTAVVQGDFSNATNSKRSRAKRATTQYFVSKGSGSQRHGLAGRKAAGYAQHLPAGVWERRVHAWGTSVRPVLLFVRGATYAKRFDFFGIAQDIIDRHLVANARVTVAEAMRTARFSVQGGLL
jgi:hypothetical protein